MSNDKVDQIGEEAEIAQDRLIAETFKRGYIDRIELGMSHSEYESMIEAIEDDEDREALMDRYATMHNAIHRLSTNLMLARSAGVPDGWEEE